MDGLLDNQHLTEIPLEYELKEVNRRKKVFVSLDSRDSTCYEIETRSMIDAILSKPDITIRKLHVSEASEFTGSIGFPRSLENNLPWLPRMSVTYDGGKRDDMELQHATSIQWIVNVNGQACTWNLCSSPASLTLYPVGSRHTLAVFTFGDCGIQVKKGEKVGTLRVMDVDENLAKEIICTLAGVMVYWERAGKMLWNRPPCIDSVVQPSYFSES